ncbi:glycosyltransferase family 2 protein [Palleronia caenipelagi]|uniref:Glycosyltransferase family 2 protein n=1 Tax=Palleronia caenipelagi TaxID=2489174 RepID=A0A547PMF6_9RHOB|nr:glycosyltransferase family A protein [Palleronia caenipelagi]TRD15330.1 glycosyltransferase family 2 protein [Palleronia caenipelagi]
MSDAPLISVVIPCFNAERTLGATLEAISSQSIDNWVVHVIDDGSTDGTVEIAAKRAAQDSRFKILRNPRKGPSAARNIGAGLSEDARFVAFCDADDIWAPDKLADSLRVLANPDAGAAYGQIAFFHEVPGDARSRSSPTTSPLSIQDLLGENPVCTMSNFTIRADLFRKIGGFDETMVHNEDLEFLIRLAGEGTQIVGTSALHVWYRTSTSGLSSDIEAMREGRVQALHTAAQFGVSADPASEAIYLRYLARRALRIGADGHVARDLAWQGLRQDISGFCTPVRRGVPTLLAALATPSLPRALRQRLFAG